MIQKTFSGTYDDKINLKDAKTDKDKKTDIQVLNGEEIVYETIENKNKNLLIILISIISFVLLLFSIGITTFIKRQIEENRLKNEEISLMLNNVG